MSDIFDQLTYGRLFARIKSHPSGLTTAIRLEPPVSAAVGYEDGFIASSECLITVKEIVAHRTFTEEACGLGRFVFVFHLGGQRIVDIPGFGKRHLSEPTFYVNYLPPGAVKKNTWLQGHHETAVVVGFWADRLPEIIKGILGPNSMMSALNSNTNHDPILVQCPLSLEMEQAARNILSPRVHRALLPSFLMTKANELLCLGLDSVLFALDPRSTQVNKLQSQIRYASQILERDIQNPPSVVELSKIVKLPTDTLTREFWNTYGVSISEFLLNQRMAVACHTLVTTDLPLKKISYEVGYRHTSNFCAAFKRHFGRTPTEVRRQGSQHVNQKTIPHNQNTLARYRKNRSITYREPLLDAYSRRESV